MPKVLVTGIAGFLGTHVAEYFLKKGWDVIGIDNLNDYELKRTNFNVENSRKHNLDFLDKLLTVEFHKWDCRLVCLNDFRGFGIDFIIHCSAQPAMTIAIENPLYDADDNIISCVNMLNIAKQLNVPFVNCSSIHIYGNQMDEILSEGTTRFTRIPDEINETQPILQGELTPLHVSKYATELYTQSFAEMYQMKTASFRFTGMYGERQFGGMDHGWVANFAIRTVMEKPITIFGTDKQVRDILYAEDAARAFYCWFTNGQPVGVYNIGGGMKNSISIGECLFKLKMFSNKKQDIKIEPKRKGDLWYFVCDYQKAKKDFKWEPEIDPNIGLMRINKWVKENKELFE
ncbi:MAG: NAD-dependent epimerase/dehydratase family protein [Chloroflexi bacterium]|nr:NAD-dependent epimerase/dehydratase family protein [Chloroflexota bacterium]